MVESASCVLVGDQRALVVADQIPLAESSATRKLACPADGTIRDGKSVSAQERPAGAALPGDRGGDRHAERSRRGVGLDHRDSHPIAQGGENPDQKVG